MNKTAKIVSGIAAGTVALYAAFGIWVLPYIVGDIIVDELKSTSPKVDVDCGMLAINPFTFSTYVSDLTISHYSFAGGEVDFSFKSFSLPIKSLNLFTNRIELGSILLEEPTIRMRKDMQHSASAAKKLNEAAKAKKVPAQADESDDWKWSIEEIKITKGTASLTDTSLKKDGTLNAHSIEFLVSGISSEDTPFDFKTSAVVLDGQCAISGDFTPLKALGHIKASAKNVNLAKLNPWLRDEADSELALGKFDFSGSGSMGGGKVNATANAEFQNIAVKKHGIAFFGAKSITVSEIKLTKLDPLTVHIGNIKAVLGLQDTLLISDVQGLLGGIVGVFGENTVSKAIAKTRLDVLSVSNITYKNGELHTDGLGTKLVKTLNSIWTK